jgi:hypothetical protein
LKPFKAAAAIAIIATLCAASDRATCPGGQFCLTETLSGVVDGKNGQFSLSRVPAPDTPVQVYRNGIPLELGEDFDVSGSTVTFANGKKPIPGDLLEASYKPGSRQLQRTRSTSRDFGIAESDEIPSALARQALSAELSHLMEHEPNGEPTPASAASQAIETDHSSSVDEAPANQKESKGISRNDRRDITVQGVDGLGDDSVESNFSGLENPDPSSRYPFHSAIQLLERRWRAAQRSVTASSEVPQGAANNPY